MKRWMIALVVLLLVAIGGWALGSPYYTLWQMKRAAEARDIDALAGHVDFDRVRDSVKTQLSDRMHGTGEAGGVIGALIRAGIADTVVDAAVSPEGMRFIFAAAPLAQTARPGTIRMKASDMRFRRVAFDRFELTRSDGAALRFRLHGMGWKLEAIQLPPDALQSGGSRGETATPAPPSGSDTP